MNKYIFAAIIVCFISPAYILPVLQKEQRETVTNQIDMAQVNLQISEKRRKETNKTIEQMQQDIKDAQRALDLARTPIFPIKLISSLCLTACSILAVWGLIGWLSVTSSPDTTKTS